MERRLVVKKGQEQADSSFGNDPMTRLWRNGQDRETGAEAVEAIRARRQQLESGTEKHGGRLRRFLLGR